MGFVLGLLSVIACRADAKSRAASDDGARPRDWYPWVLPARARLETVHDRFTVPAGCRRISYARGSFADWVQHLPLQPAGATALDFRGEAIASRMLALALVDMDVLPRGKDLQQCADYALRLGYEYLARFQPGIPRRWRLQSGKPYRFTPSPARRVKDLIHLFQWLGTFGLKAYYPAVSSPRPYQPGDILVGNSTGAIGHAVVVHDVIECAGAERRYLVSQSWIPAQTPHIPRLTDDEGATYLPRDVLDAFVRDVTGDRRVAWRRLPGIPEAAER
jgi:hypothetical protein